MSSSPNSPSLTEILEYFALAWLATIAVIGARVTQRLARQEPPVQPDSMPQWLYRRRWILIAEFAASPTFALVAVLVCYWTEPSYLLAITMGFIAGALGFPFLVHAIEATARAQLGITPPSAAKGERTDES